MTRRTLVLTSLLFLLAAGESRGQFGTPAIELDKGYMLEPTRDDLTAVIGAPLSVYGRVAVATSPLLAGQETSHPGAEFTYAITGLICRSNGTSCPYPAHCSYSSSYHPGRLAIYRDITPDADLAHPETYRDGDLLLSGPVSDLVLVLSTSNTNYAPVATSENYFEEGELVDSFRNGAGEPLRVPGVGAFQTQVGTGLAALGYRGWIVMSLNLTEQVPAEPTTWSGIKSLYSR